MRKVLFAVTLTVLAQLMGACNADLRGNAINTDVTFTVQAFHATTLDPVVPMIEVMATIPGHEPWLMAENVPAPHRFTVYSRDYPQAIYQIDITATLITPNPDVVLRCSWSAQTPSGVRLSRESADGEGESYAGQDVHCKYQA